MIPAKNYFLLPPLLQNSDAFSKLMSLGQPRKTSSKLSSASSLSESCTISSFHSINSKCTNLSSKSDLSKINSTDDELEENVKESSEEDLEEESNEESGNDSYSQLDGNYLKIPDYQFQSEIIDEMEKKISMFYRKPICIKKTRKCFDKYEEQISYFSERMAVEQYNEQKQPHVSYSLKHGRYSDCRGVLLEKLHQPQSFQTIRGLAFSKSGDFLAIGYGSGAFKICSIETRRFCLPLPEGRLSTILCVRNHPDSSNNMFVGSTRKGIILICNQQPTMWRIWEYGQETNNEINSFDFNASGTKMVTGGKDATLREYDFQTGKIIKVYKKYNLDCERLIQLHDEGVHNLDDGSGHYLRIHAVKFIENHNDIFLSGGIDNTVKIWDTRSYTNPVQNINGPHICGDALDILDYKVLTGQWTFARSIELWDIRTSRKLHTMMPSNRGQPFVNEFVYCCKFLRHWDRVGLPDAHSDLIAVGGSGLEALEVQSIDYNKTLHRFLENGHIMSLAQYEELLVYGTNTNTIGFCIFLPINVENERVNIRKSNFLSKLFKANGKRLDSELSRIVLDNYNQIMDDNSSCSEEMWSGMFLDYCEDFDKPYLEKSKTWKKEDIFEEHSSMMLFQHCNDTNVDSEPETDDDSDFDLNSESLSDNSVFNVPSDPVFMKCGKSCNKDGCCA